MGNVRRIKENERQCSVCGDDYSKFVQRVPQNQL